MNAHFDNQIHHSPPSYTAYLVRFWQDGPNSPWRASAQSVQTGEIVRFGSQQALYEFLETEVFNPNKQRPDVQLHSKATEKK
ncbi:MAG: hypothetical protein R3A44_18965 [Caldilineaceae bacterium]